MGRLITPGKALGHLLIEAGINGICVTRPFNKKRLLELGLQEIAISILIDELSVCKSDGNLYCKPLLEDHGVEIAVPNREGRAYDYVVARRNCSIPVISWRDLYQQLPSPPLPAVVVDMSKRNIHTEEELSSLKVQLAITLSVVRRYLWDPHLILSSAGEDVKSWLADMIGNAKIQIRSERPGRILWSMSADKVIILRPDAEKVLTEQEIVEADAFLIGGVVDKIPRPGVSRFLDSAVPWGKPRRIELRGSLVGVPERINRIVEILFKVKFDGMRLEEAILTSMTKKDVYRRLHVEIMRASKGGKKPLSRQHYEMLKTWLPINCRDYLEVATKSGVPVGWDCEGEDNSG